MDCEWELRRQGDDRYVLTRLPPDAAAILKYAARSEPSLALRFRNNGVLRWAAGVPHERVRAAVDAAVVPARQLLAAEAATAAAAAAAMAGEAGSTAAAAHRVSDDDAAPSLVVAALRWESLLWARACVDAFADYVEHCRWRARREFVRWVDAPDLHARLVAAVEDRVTNHAMERAWERLARGPVDLGRCLDSRYRVMETVRLRVVVVGTGAGAGAVAVDLAIDGTAVMDWSERQDARVRRDDGEPVALAPLVADHVLRVLAAAARAGAPLHAAAAESSDMEDPAKQRRRELPPALAGAVVTALRTRSARAFILRRLRAITTVGTLIFDAAGTELITCFADNGACEDWLTEARALQQQITWRMQGRVPLTRRERRR